MPIVQDSKLLYANAWMQRPESVTVQAVELETKPAAHKVATKNSADCRVGITVRNPYDAGFSIMTLCASLVSRVSVAVDHDLDCAVACPTISAGHCPVSGASIRRIFDRASPRIVTRAVNIQYRHSRVALFKDCRALGIYTTGCSAVDLYLEAAIVTIATSSHNPQAIGW